MALGRRLGVRAPCPRPSPSPRPGTERQARATSRMGKHQGHGIHTRPHQRFARPQYARRAGLTLADTRTSGAVRTTRWWWAPRSAHREGGGLTGEGGAPGSRPRGCKPMRCIGVDMPGLVERGQRGQVVGAARRAPPHASSGRWRRGGELFCSSSAPLGAA